MIISLIGERKWVK